MGARILNGLAVALVIATGVLAIGFLALALRPLPHPTPSPTPAPEGKTVEASPSPALAPAPLPFPTPTPLLLATPSPFPTPRMPFTVLIEPASTQPCTRTTLVGMVTDREGKGLAGYPLHLWGPGLDTVIFTDSRGRWEIVLPTGGEWNVQLHAPDPETLYPPLSAIAAVSLPEDHPCALVTFVPVEVEQRDAISGGRP